MPTMETLEETLKVGGLVLMEDEPDFLKKAVSDIFKMGASLSEKKTDEIGVSDITDGMQKVVGDMRLREDKQISSDLLECVNFMIECASVMPNYLCPRSRDEDEYWDEVNFTAEQKKSIVKLGVVARRAKELAELLSVE